ncbi:hypothetical protein ATY89_08615 [Sulfolobus acidocaldarius]|uniref:Uncharacterized protein n=3 Tax=Sulfolobus acidocaldarius TaxID=2285 RepID=A0A0U3FQN9_9CREN|nr:hypothetical protein SacN8_09300 [Sulfolobus acidocaldarius N8]AGE74091.1 hypothetical protein SacRon12I_09320 [Sulfolobus acidocaldarius Ron12/I]ALU30631.1 hypothetical protein ATY89_08615 [Sulfolobus acidocaldarius]ALU32715.1 hypothetical protein ATZ20_00025 [Sulfolobus acidocaldarius]WCM36071.1 hypothetical protein GO597_10335 [Sulfolobus acidocaldarius DSM 639]
MKYDPKSPKIYAIRVELGSNIERSLWTLKSFIRCYALLCNRDFDRSVFGSGKKDLPFMSRILMSYEPNELKIICLINEQEECDRLFNMIENALNYITIKENGSRNIIDRKKEEEILSECSSTH